MLETLKLRILAEDLTQLAICDADLESFLSSAGVIVAGYCVVERMREELTIKIAHYNIYLRLTTQMPAVLIEDYKQTLKILESLKNSGIATSSDSFTPKCVSRQKESMDGF
jgi:hypothetical protein